MILLLVNGSNAGASGLRLPEAPEVQWPEHNAIVQKPKVHLT